MPLNPRPLALQMMATRLLLGGLDAMPDPDVLHGGQGCTPHTCCPQGKHLSMGLSSFGMVALTHHLARAQSHQCRRQKGYCSTAKNVLVHNSATGGADLAFLQ